MKFDWRLNSQYSGLSRIHVTRTIFTLRTELITPWILIICKSLSYFINRHDVDILLIRLRGNSCYIATVHGFPLRNPHLKNTGVGCGAEVKRVFVYGRPPRLRTKKKTISKIRIIPHFYCRIVDHTRAAEIILNGQRSTRLHRASSFNQLLTIITAITVIIIIFIIFSFSRDGDTRK